MSAGRVQAGVGGAHGPWQIDRLDATERAAAINENLVRIKARVTGRPHHVDEWGEVVPITLTSGERDAVIDQIANELGIDLSANKGG